MITVVCGVLVLILVTILLLVLNIVIILFLHIITIIGIGIVVDNFILGVRSSQREDATWFNYVRRVFTRLDENG